jgi:hypothetical protein
MGRSFARWQSSALKVEHVSRGGEGNWSHGDQMAAPCALTPTNSQLCPLTEGISVLLSHCLVIEVFELH